MATATATVTMSNSNPMRRRLAGGVQALILLPIATGVAGFSPTATGGDWKLTDSTTGRLTLVDRSDNNSSSGTVVQVSPQITLTGRGGRSEADLAYRLTASQGTGKTDPIPLAHDLRARGRVELVDQFFWLGGNANAQLVGNSTTSGPVDAINVESSGRQGYSVQLTPEFRHHLGRYADVVSQNSVDYVAYSGNGVSSNDDSSSYSANLGVQSGPYFGPLSWNLSATQRKTKYDTREDENSSYTVGAGYQVDPRVRVRGNVGYETNDVQSNRSNTDGSVWTVGVDWTPNPRTGVSADYGRRYLGSIYSGRINHRTKRSALTVDFSRDVTNRRSTQLEEFQLLVPNPNAEPGDPPFFIDPDTNQPFTVPVFALQQIDEDYVNTQIRGALAVSGRRTTATVTASLANRKYEVTAADEDSYGLSFAVSRQLGAGFSGTVRSSLLSTDVNGGTNTDTYDVQFSLSKQISPRTSASVDLLHRNQDSSTAGGDYTENRLGVSVSTSFL